MSVCQNCKKWPTNHATRKSFIFFVLIIMDLFDNIHGNIFAKSAVGKLADNIGNKSYIRKLFHEDEYNDDVLLKLGKNLMGKTLRFKPATYEPKIDENAGWSFEPRRGKTAMFIQKLNQNELVWQEVGGFQLLLLKSEGVFHRAIRQVSKEEFEKLHGSAVVFDIQAPCVMFGTEIPLLKFDGSITGEMVDYFNQWFISGKDTYAISVRCALANIKEKHLFAEDSINPNITRINIKYKHGDNYFHSSYMHQFSHKKLEPFLIKNKQISSMVRENIDESTPQQKLGETEFDIVLTALSNYIREKTHNDLYGIAQTKLKAAFDGLKFETSEFDDLLAGY